MTELNPAFMDMPKTAIMDGDMIAYRASVVAQSLDEVRFSVTTIAQNWRPPGVNKIYVAMSCSRTDNYRRDFWPDYKAHREDPPEDQADRLRLAKEILEDLYDCKWVARTEADDLMGVLASGGQAIAVTLDKDLLSTPGWHYRPEFSYWGGADENGIRLQKTKPAQLRRVSLWEADFNFHSQWLRGDMTDGFAGLKGVGPKKAEKILLSTPSQNWTEAVLAEYEKRGHDLEYALAMAHCARILRWGDWERPDRLFYHECMG